MVKKYKTVSTKTRIARAEALLRGIIEEQLPELVKACSSKKGNLIVLHQDAFAGGYQPSEYFLLGAAIKYAGLHGKEVRIIGKNRETIDGKR
jgi:hypothetical protein